MRRRKVCSLTVRRANNEFTGWDAESLVKTWDDFRIWAKYRPIPVKADFGCMIEAKDRLGDKGIIRVHPFSAGQGNPWQSLCMLMGTEEAIFAAFDEPDMVHEALEAILQMTLKTAELWRGIPGDMIETGGAAGSNTVISPKMFREFCLPYDRWQNEAFHACGLKIAYLLCGGLMRQMDMVAECGDDGLETMTSRSMGGDCDFKEASRRVGDRLFFIGSFDQSVGFERGTPATARKFVHECFEATKDHAGYIIAPNDHFFFGDPENLKAFCDAVRECVYWQGEYMVMIETIYVVFKTHFDIGYTELAAEVIDRYGRKMLPDVIHTCEGTQALGRGHCFVWTMSAWPLTQSLSPSHASVEDIEAAKGLICEGQIAWHLLPYTTHTEFCGLEEYIRGFRFSRALSSEYGFWPVASKMTDVPGHTWILPTLLNKAGVKFLHLGCNPGCMPPDVPHIFFWEGPDGSRVLTFYNKGYYGSSLVPPEGWPFPVWLALMQTNDNIGPQGLDVIERILDAVRQELPDTNVVVGTMDDFYHALSIFPMEDIPVVRGDLADTWIHGVGTYPREVSLLRSLRLNTVEAEKAFCTAVMLGCLGWDTSAALQSTFESIYELSLLFGEHTWGLDVKSTLWNRYYMKREFLAHKRDDDVLRIEESWDEQRGRVLGAQKLLNGALPKIMDALAGNVSALGRRLVSFNGLGWGRSAWVDVSALHPDEGDSVIDLETGEALHTAWVEGRLMAYVKDLPAIGYRTLAMAEKAAPSKKSVKCDAETGVIENRWFRVRADAATGTVTSLLEKETGREFVDNSAGYGLGQYRYDVYGIEDITEYIRSYAYRFSGWLLDDLGRIGYPEIGHSAFYAKGFTMTSSTNGMCSSLVLTAEIRDSSVEEFGNAASLETQIMLYENEPYIDLSIRLISKQETPYIEAGHIVMPFNLKNHEVRINKLGSVINPLTDFVKDANHGLYCCENWVDLFDGECGMALIPFDMPLFSMGDQSIYKYQREPSPKPPVLFFNLFNNSWGTNFPQWIGGGLSFRYRLIPHRGDWREGLVQQKVLESVMPVLTGIAEGERGSLPPVFNMMNLSEGVSVSAFKPAYDGNGYVLRLRELNGEANHSELKLSLKGTCVSACDLLERNAEDKANNGTDTQSLEMKPFDIRSLLIKYNNKGEQA